MLTKTKVLYLFQRLTKKLTFFKKGPSRGVIGITLDSKQLILCSLLPNSSPTQLTLFSRLNLESENMNTNICMIKNSNPKNEKAYVIALPDNEFKISYVPLPRPLTKNEMDKQLSSLIKEHHLDSRSLFDYQTIKIHQKEHLLFCSIKKQIIEEHLEKLEKLGIHVIAIEPLSHSIERFFYYFYPQWKNNYIFYIHLSETEITSRLIKEHHTECYQTELIHHYPKKSEGILYHFKHAQQYCYPDHITACFATDSLKTDLSELSSHFHSIKIPFLTEESILENIPTPKEKINIGFCHAIISTLGLSLFPL